MSIGSWQRFFSLFSCTFKTSDSLKFWTTQDERSCVMLFLHCEAFFITWRNLSHLSYTLKNSPFISKKSLVIWHFFKKFYSKWSSCNASFFSFNFSKNALPKISSVLSLPILLSSLRLKRRSYKVALKMNLLDRYLETNIGFLKNFLRIFDNHQFREVLPALY